jgi:hypothetical protein
MSPFDILDDQMMEPFHFFRLSGQQVQTGSAVIASFFIGLLTLVSLTLLSRIPAYKKVVDAETLVLEYRTLYEGVLERIATLETELKAKDTQLGCELIEVQRNEHDHYLETERLEAAVDAEFDANRKDMVEMVDDRIDELKDGLSSVISEKLNDLPISEMSDELTFLRESAISHKDELDEHKKRMSGFSTALPTLLGLDPQIKALEAQVKALPIESLEQRLASVSSQQALNDAYLKTLETQVKASPEALSTRLASLANVQAMSDQNMKALIKAVETRQTLDHETLQTTAGQIKDDLKTVVQFLLIFYPKGTALLTLSQKNGWSIEAPSLPPPPAAPVSATA